ncbi:MAG: single-stranded-DNA-specific exonuclease RecJ [Nitrospirae bacterium]|nr:single-stranded-DNA-specific exonuclease RecJ [Nitrospirota bacterium]
MVTQPQAQPIRFRWRVPPIDPAARRALREALGVSRIAAQVLLNRGLVEPAAARAFLAAGDAALHDPFRFRDMRRAVERVERAIAAGEAITVYGDYDVDGISGAALLSEFFAMIGYPVGTFVPDRFADGYGLNPERVADLARAGTRLIITTDNGTSAHQAVERAGALGVDVIVTDHHEVSGPLPPAYAVLNPHRHDGTYPEKGLCGVGVAFKLCHAILIRRGEATADALPPRLMPLLDLVALGTVADVAPLTGENRVLVRHGLELLSAERRPGVGALKAVAGLAGQPVGAGQVGFHLGPRINAGGRVADGGQGVALLTTRDPERALAAARYLDQANQERRAIEADILEDVLARIQAGGEPGHCIVLAAEGWHAGVLGIIASRVVERYHRPCILIALDGGGTGKGSGRSIPALHLFDALSACADLLLGFGGHMAAAGVTVEASQVAALAARLDGEVGRRLAPDDFRPQLRLDASARLDEIHQGLLDEFARIAPFGPGNPEPVLLLPGVVPERVRPVGNGHIKLTLAQPDAPGRRLEAIAFGAADWLGGAIAEGVPVDLAGSVTANRWQGRDTIQLRVRDLRARARAAGGVA